MFPVILVLIISLNVVLVLYCGCFVFLHHRNEFKSPSKLIMDISKAAGNE